MLAGLRMTLNNKAMAMRQIKVDRSHSPIITLPVGNGSTREGSALGSQPDRRRGCARCFEREQETTPADVVTPTYDSLSAASSLAANSLLKPSTTSSYAP